MPYIGNVTTSSNVNGSQINNGTITGDKLSLPFDYDSATLYLNSVNNRVGIGTTSPDGNLTIGGLTNTGGESVDAINVNRTDGLRLFGVKWDVTSNEVRFSGNTKNYVFRNGSSEAETARIDSSGRVGIGTSSPNYQLHVTTDFAVGASGFNQQLTFSNDTIQSLLLGTGYTALKLNPLGGNVGIGTTSPGATLDVSGNIRLSAGSPNIEFNNGGAMVYGPAGNTLAFATGGGPSAPQEKARIDSSGRLLVGTSTAVGNYALQIEANNGSDPFEGAVFLRRGISNATISTSGFYLGTIAAGSQTNVGGFIRFESDAAWGSGDYPTRLVFSTTADGAASPTERFRISSDGSFSSVIPGGSTLYPQFGCRAWVNFNGTGTVAIRSSGNVSSITDNGVGDYTVNFTTAMPDVNYALSVNGYQTTTNNVFVGYAGGQTYTTTAVRLSTINSSFAATDMQNVSVAIFR